MKRVLVFGTFDNLHPGHLDFFKQAKNRGDYLIAAVARDKTTFGVKGHLPRQNENERLEAVKNCGLVDEAVLGNLGDPYEIIKKIKPDIIALGYDQTSFTTGLPEYIKKEGLAIETIRLKPFKPETYKSSLIKK